MLCIFCINERPASREHVVPLAVGGTITTDRVCKHCNSMLGSRVDVALSDFFPIRTRRAQLGLKGNAGEAPYLFEMLLGEGKLIGRAANRVQTTFNKKTGKLDARQLYHASTVVRPDGTKARQITLDARDIGQLPIIIQRERKRQGLPPLSAEQLTVAAQDFTATTVDKPLIQKSISVSFAFLRHAMIKIAYELAFLWLGEAYLDDPLAAEMRAAICADDLASTDHLFGYVGDAANCTAFDFWTPHEAHHLAYASIVTMNDIANVVVCVRIFDLYAAAIVVSCDPNRYIRHHADRMKLRFLAIDSVSGQTIDTSFDGESRRLAEAMTQHRRKPPFSDPLATNKTDR